MLQIRPSCEHCNKQLPYNASDPMICTFECTFCKECVDDILLKVCPNCGGGFEKRPIRPEHLLQKYPASTITVHKPVNVALYQQKIKAL